MAVASLVLGIVSIVFTVFTAGALGWLGAIIGLIGVILGAMAKKDPEKKGMATAGFVCSIIGLVLGLILYVACAACVGATASGLANLS
ncbi:MAG: hypothetical protein Q4F63_05510 [Clostridia bacterium]|nr:hypothetical protein [Clostridia bacterium]